LLNKTILKALPLQALFVELKIAAFMASILLAAHIHADEKFSSAYTPIPPYDALSGTFVIFDLIDDAGRHGEARLLVGDQLKACLAVSRQFGLGYWSWSNNGFSLHFRDREFTYGQRADPPINDDTVDIGGCSTLGYKRAVNINGS